MFILNLKRDLNVNWVLKVPYQISQVSVWMISKVQNTLITPSCQSLKLFKSSLGPTLQIYLLNENGDLCGIVLPQCRFFLSPRIKLASI
jgi:hypothetical protein